jgi:hypothetical protein
MSTRRQRDIARFDPYRVTSFGPNPWSNEALSNVMMLKEHIDRAVELLGGRITSCYRSPKINKAVGGAFNSRHLRGLAVDIVPGPGLNAEKAARLIFDEAGKERLGIVRNVIWEPSWVHIGWYALTEEDAGMKLLQKVKGGYATLATSSMAKV